LMECCLSFLHFFIFNPQPYHCGDNLKLEVGR